METERLVCSVRPFALHVRKAYDSGMTIVVVDDNTIPNKCE